MENTKDNKRRDFLMKVCPTVAMAFLGITVLDSCSSGDDDSDYGEDVDDADDTGDEDDGEDYDDDGSDDDDDDDGLWGC